MVKHIRVQPKDRQNAIHPFQALEPQVTKIVRRVHKNQHRHQSKTKPPAITTVHPSSDYKHYVPSVPYVLVLRHHPKQTYVHTDPRSQSSVDEWYSSNSETITTDKTTSDTGQDHETHSSARYLRPKSLKVSNFHQVIGNASAENHENIESENRRTNGKRLPVEHHRVVKKSNKRRCSPRLSLIIPAIVGLLLLLTTVILLGIFLSRQPKKTITRDREVVLRWNSTGITVAGVVGQFGNASNYLNVPFGLALDWSSTLYIADWSNHRVQKYLKDSSSGQTVAGQATGVFNTTSNFLYYPGCVAIDWESNVYVADTFNNRIQLWTNGASAGVTIAGTGSIGNTSYELNRPYKFTRDPNTGTLYIADSSNNRVMRYLSGASSGTVVAGGQGGGLSNNQLFSPYGIYFDSLSNSLIIANGNANNLVRWTLGDSNWTLLAGNINGASGNTTTELNLPMDVTLDPMGNMYVADRQNHRIQFFPVGDTNGITIAGMAGISGSSSTSLNTPMSVALDGQLNLYVADAFNSRVQKFLRY